VVDDVGGPADLPQPRSAGEVRQQFAFGARQPELFCDAAELIALLPPLLHLSGPGQQARQRLGPMSASRISTIPIVRERGVGSGGSSRLGVESGGQSAAGRWWWASAWTVVARACLRGLLGRQSTPLVGSRGYAQASRPYGPSMDG
jgi:hypothetical protein